MGCESIIKCIFISFLTGAGISAALLIFNHNFCERILYFIEYVKCTVSTGKISSYRRKNIAAPENFHFTIPVFIKIFYKELFFVFKRIFATSAGDLPDSVKF